MSIRSKKKIKFKFFSFFFKSFFLLSNFYLFIIIFCNLFLDPWETSKFLFFNISKIASESMEPNIFTGDLVITKNLSESEKKKLKCSDSVSIKNPKGQQNGDVIVFVIETKEKRYSNLAKKLIIHRVVKNDPNEKKISTYGDHNSEQLPFEKLIPYKNVLYKFLFRIPFQFLYFCYFLFFVYFVKNIYDWLKSL